MLLTCCHRPSALLDPKAWNKKIQAQASSALSKKKTEHPSAPLELPGVEGAQSSTICGEPLTRRALLIQVLPEHSHTAADGSDSSWMAESKSNNTHDIWTTAQRCEQCLITCLSQVHPTALQVSIFIWHLLSPGESVNNLWTWVFQRRIPRSDIQLSVK